MRRMQLPLRGGSSSCNEEEEEEVEEGGEKEQPRKGKSVRERMLW